MAGYAKTSLYGATPIRNGSLDILKFRDLPFKRDDVVYKIEPQYNYRPDLLASDVYNDPNLWWVFKARNPSVIDDPVFDFVAGVEIFVPDGDVIRSVIGGS
jgi:hypothetical protein